MALHIHTYDQSSRADDNLTDEFDVERTGSYDGYTQYAFERRGELIEVRVPTEPEPERGDAGRTRAAVMAALDEYLAESEHQGSEPSATDFGLYLHVASGGRIGGYVGPTWLVEEISWDGTGEGTPTFHAVVSAATLHAAFAGAQQRAGRAFLFGAGELTEITPGYFWEAGDGSSVAYQVRKIG